MESNSPGQHLTDRYLVHVYSSRLEKKEVLLILTSAVNLKSFVSNPNMTSESASLLLHLCAVGLQCIGQAGPCLELLCMLVDSPLLGLNGLRLLQHSTKLSAKYHSFDCLVDDFIVILNQLFICLPSSTITPKIIGILDFLSELVLSCKELRNKDSKSETVTRLKDAIIQMLKDRSKVKAKPKYIDESEDKLLPPDDFRRISVLPRDCDIFRNPEFLRRNKKEGKYLNLEHYLDVQFRLYREDFISPLRNAMKEYMQFTQIQRGQHGRSIRLEDGRLYQNVMITGTTMSEECGEVYEIQLDHNHSRHIDWFTSKRLIYGSLVCLSFDDFRTVIFAVITDSDRKNLQHAGIFKAQIFITHRDQIVKSQLSGVMIESSSAYFEAYRHVLEALKNIHGELPFERYIVDCQKEICQPKYLTCSSSTYDFTSIISKRLHRSSSRSLVNVLDIEEWPSMEDLQLDEAQWEAFHAALTQEYVVIQGPPGTGKTHIGLQIAKTLLHNKLKWNGSYLDDTPRGCMLIVCFTNHALDQFLEGIIQFSNSETREYIVRIGSRCKNKQIEDYTLSNHRHRLLKENTGKARALNKAKDIKYETIRLVRTLKYRIGSIRLILQTLQTEYIVLNFHTLKDVISTQHRAEFGTQPISTFFQWLQVTEDCWFKAVEEFYQGRAISKASVIYQRGTLPKPRRKTNYIDVISEAEYEFTERHIEGDSMGDGPYSVKDEIGLDITIQLEKNERKNLEEKCHMVLRMEAEKAKQNIRSGETISLDVSDLVTNLWELDLDERWKFYRLWVKQYIKNLKDRLEQAEKLLNSLFDQYKEARLQLDQEIMERATVIALTTTAAARYYNTLSQLRPTITIIEEAAEVLEAHIITALSRHCEHVILIGDHKQLEPKPAVYELAVKYNLSISLFERMINNGLPYYCLQRQHRMRPEISELIRHIYPVLQDNDNVVSYGDIGGVRQNLFFLTHSVPEAYNDDGRSYSNEFEAEYSKELCRYLLNQGYKSSEITILAAYSGQMFCIREKMPRDDFEGITICVLDNYQGEENEIIILSLVRSNKKGDIGFLNKENRICVALSRARKGFYILGNMDTLTHKSRHWETIHQKLKREDKKYSEAHCGVQRSFIGKELLLYCQNHPDKPDIQVACALDFHKTPNGGCGIPCEFRLNCGHACRHKCHSFDREHEEYQCDKHCPKTCSEGHKCQQICHEPDDCKCPMLLEKSLPCGHINFVKCHVKPSEHSCKTQIERKLRRCRHTASMYCHEDINAYKCKEIVTDTWSKCNHTYQRICHKLKESYERKNKCQIQVERVIKSCGHSITVDCHMDVSIIECRENIVKEFRCGHSIETICFRATKQACTERCNKICEMGHICPFKCHFRSPCKCTEPVEKILPGCEHKQEMACSTDPESFKCQLIVNKTSTRCGHTNAIECFKDPDTIPCQVPVTKRMPSCNHEQLIPCGTDPLVTMVHCESENEVVLDKCGHTIKVKCWETKPGVEHICETLVPYTYPACKHNSTIACNIKTTLEHTDTPKKINIPPCRHEVLQRLSCGHVLPIECHEIGMKTKCNLKCDKLLFCGHDCLKQCINCLGGDFHRTCIKKCEREQICGHKCIDNACLKCKLCKKQCLYACEHSRCNSLCSDQCKPCLKQCTWQCSHYKCTKLCNEICNRPKCPHPCKKILDCGHKCLGFCSEPCPEACIGCRPDIFPLDDSNPCLKWSRTVTLKKCGHTFIDKYLDDFMRKMKDELVTKCPVCKVVIQKHPRYDRILKCKKRFIEDAKKKLLETSVSGRIISPIFTSDPVKSIEDYMMKFTTYRHIVRFINTEEYFVQRLADATCFATKIQQIIERSSTKDVQVITDVYRQLYKLYVYWMLCICTGKSEVLDFKFSTNAISGIQQFILDRTPSTENMLSNDTECEKSYDEMGARPKDKSTRSTRPVMDRRDVSGLDIINVLKDTIEDSDFDRMVVDKLLSCLMDITEVDIHLENAKSYPLLPDMIGIHEDEWKICRKGKKYLNIFLLNFI